MDHIEFVAQVYRKQVREGRYFLHEHPAGATSWGLTCIQNLRREDEVLEVMTDQCMFGLETKGETKGMTARAQKSTRFMTTSAETARSLNRRCDRSHWHQLYF